MRVSLCFSVNLDDLDEPHEHVDDEGEAERTAHRAQLTLGDLNRVVHVLQQLDDGVLLAAGHLVRAHREVHEKLIGARSN